jgi:hypothetical protein
VRSLLLAALCACAVDPGESSSLAPRDGGAPPGITLRDVEFVQSRGNTVFARGRVSHMNYLSENGDTLAEVASVQFPREREPGTAVDISAPRARGNPLEARVTGEGGVHVANQQGDRGQTDSATYDGRRGQAFGNSPVGLFGPGFELRSPGFKWTQAGDQLDLGPSELVTRGRAQ